MKILLCAVTFVLFPCAGIKVMETETGTFSAFNLKIYFPATASQKVDGEHLMYEGDYIFDGDYGVRML